MESTLFNQGSLSLAQLNASIKKGLEGQFPTPLWVRAEISSCSVATAGHCYLDLVELNPGSRTPVAKMRANIWSSRFRRIDQKFLAATGQRMQQGMGVLLQVRITYHVVYGLALEVLDVDPSFTLGALAQQRQQTIARLIAEGIYDINRKLPMPPLPKRIAVISSPTAAGYGDFMNHLADTIARYGLCVQLFEALMQGDSAPESIIAALNRIFEHLEQWDAVVIIRGGGSTLDLHCFDDYELAAHVAQFPLPILTGIGHERDTSVVDMVAHTMLKTPTAVANALNDLFHNLDLQLQQLRLQLQQRVEEYLGYKSLELDRLYRRLRDAVRYGLGQWDRGLALLRDRVALLLRGALQQQELALAQRRNSAAQTLKNDLWRQAQHLDTARAQLSLGLTGQLHGLANPLDRLAEQVRQMAPDTVLARGYAQLTQGAQVVTSTQQLLPRTTVCVQLSDGQATLQVK